MKRDSSAKAPGARTRHQAENLSQTRREHANEIAEDYVEAIADLVAETGEARVVDLAKRLGVTHVTVNRTIGRLQKAGFVTSQPYRAIFLTEQGHAFHGTYWHDNFGTPMSHGCVNMRTEEAKFLFLWALPKHEIGKSTNRGYGTAVKIFYS